MNKINKAFSIQFIVLFFGLLVSNVSAETFVVTRIDDPTPDGCAVGDCSLREAIIAANDDNSENHTIQLTGGLTYTLSITGDVYSGPVIIEGEDIGLEEFSTNDEEGALKILNVDRTIRIESTGGGMAEIDADGTGPVFMILDETVAELDGLKITGGDNSVGGGFIVAYNESLTITNSLITENTARKGAGMDVYGGNVVFEDSEISLNESTSDGVPLAGAMSLSRAPAYQGITTLAELDDIEYTASNVTIQNSTISNNTADVGGAFDVAYESTLNVIESTVSGNRAYARGGAFNVNRATVNIDRSTISGNIARNEEGFNGRGGGFFIGGIQDSDEAAEILIINSTVSGNETGNGVNSGTAGGIYVDNFGAKNVDIINSTITNNTGWSVGGILAFGGTINVANSIIANQAAGDDCQISDQGEEPLVYTSLGYNLESGTSCGFTETGDLQNLEPFLGPLQDNGGPVFTHALSADPLSPAINNGSNTLYTNAGGNLGSDSDANGNDRVYNFGSGGIIDIGAFELQQEGTVVGCPVTHEDNILFVKKGESGTGANWSNALGELRDALALFEDGTCTTDDVEEIWVSAGTYLATDDSGDREATFLMPGVDIYGGFEGDETNKNQRNLELNTSIMSGEINSDNNLSGNSYHVVSSMDEASGVLFDFTITGGNADGSDPHDKGGGLYASNGGISMSNVLFENNYAETAGGGAYVIETVNRIGAQHPAFFRVTFANNKTGDDGDGGGLALKNAESRITSVMFENNTADRYGGGLFNDQSDPVLKNVIFKENSADLEGGGMLNNLSSPELFNVLITNNDAFVNGGGMVNGTNSIPVLTNVTISGNNAENGNGGGMYNRNGAMPVLLNTIVWENSANSTGNEIWNSSNSSIELDYSLFSDGADDVVDGDGFTALNSWTTNPQFTDAPGGDFTLMGSSPAINTGDPDTDLSDFKIFGSDEIDLAENPRVYNGTADPDTIDIGAYEFQGEPTEEPEFAPFITTWKTDNEGPSEDDEITIPITGIDYNYDIYWEKVGNASNNGTMPGQTGSATIEFGSPGIYKVEISGDFPRIFFNDAGDKLKLLTIEQWGDVLWADMGFAFQGAANLEVNASDAPDLRVVDYMTSMFEGATSLNSDLNNWNTSNVKEMKWMFAGATSFNGDISSWDVRNVTHMTSMFEGATAFNQDISGWQTDNLEEMFAMFSGATSFNRDISGWTTTGVTDMDLVFAGAESFNQNLSNWDVSGVTTMDDMLSLSGMSSSNYDNTLIGWESQSVQNDVGLGATGLQYCDAVNERQALIDDHNWDITGDSEGCNFAPFITTWEVEDGDLQITIPTAAAATYNYDVDWGDGDSDTGQTGDASHTYDSADTYTVKITGMFPQIEFGNTGDKDKIMSVEQWGDIEWGSMRKAFQGATNLVINATDTPDLSNATSMLEMFSGATSVNGGLENWNVSTINSMFGLFDGATSFNGNISGWNVSAATDMIRMFAGATAFDRDIGGWTVDNVNTMESMFDGATLFNQDLSGWNTGDVGGMSWMFHDAAAFNQNLGDWDIKNVSSMTEMLDGSGLSQVNYDNTLIGWEDGTVKDDVELGAEGLQYCAGKEEREALMTDHNWSFIGDSEVAECSDAVVLTAPTLTSPSDEATDIDRPVTLDWNSADGAESYSVQLVEESGSFDTPDFDDETTDTDIEVTGLNASTEYMWRVRSLTSEDQSEWSEIWSFTTSAEDEPVTAADGRVLASNLNGHTFSPADFSQTDNNASVIVKSLPGNGDLELDGSGVSVDDEITVGDVDDGDLIYTPTAGGHGAKYDEFDFKVKNAVGTESTDTYTMTIDVGAASVELTGGEGWRFLGNPSTGGTYGGFLGPIWTKGVPGSDNPGSSLSNVYMLDQSNYEWDEPGNMSNTTTQGQAFIVYVYSDDDNDGTPEGFPKTLTSGENWGPLDGSFSYSGLEYNESASNPDNFYLVANPHPVSLDFCEFTRSNVANSLVIWNPAANGGNGDYVSNPGCGLDDVFIAPFQGFWVRTTDASPALEIRETAYLETAESGYFKNQSADGYIEAERSAMSKKNIADLGDGFLLTLNVTSQDNVFTNTTRLLFSEKGTAVLDTWDAPKLSPARLANRWLSFYSLDKSDRAYALQNLPADFSEKIHIPLDIQTTEADRYTLNWELPESQVFSGSYFLRDNVSGEVIELTDGSQYHFEIEPNQASKGTEPLKDFVKAVTQQSNGSEPRFELLITQDGVDGMAALGAVPDSYELAQNYPNPFNPTTVISYQLPVNSEVRLEVYDMLGRNVATLVNEQKAAGRHTVNFDASGLSSGIYLYRLQAGSQIMTRKLTVVK